MAPQRSAALKPGKLHIAPIVGAPVNVVTPLTHRMNDDAKTKGIELAGNNDPSAAYVMKGYFSVLSEDNQTTVLYVWDVLDASGNRLHRIQGQEKVRCCRRLMECRSGFRNADNRRPNHAGIFDGLRQIAHRNLLWQQKD